MKRIERVAIIGAGNGGCAAAVDLALRGFEVRLYGRTPATLAPLKARGGIEYEGIFGEGAAKIGVITNDAAEAMRGADAVLAMAPAHAHENIAASIAPHLTGSRRPRRAGPYADADPAHAATPRPLESAHLHDVDASLHLPQDR